MDQCCVRREICARQGSAEGVRAGDGRHGLPDDAERDRPGGRRRFECNLHGGALEEAEEGIVEPGDGHGVRRDRRRECGAAGALVRPLELGCTADGDGGGGSRRRRRDGSAGDIDASRQWAALQPGSGGAADGHGDRGRHPGGAAPGALHSRRGSRGRRRIVVPRGADERGGASGERAVGDRGRHGDGGLRLRGRERRSGLRRRRDIEDGDGAYADGQGRRGGRVVHRQADGRERDVGGRGHGHDHGRAADTGGVGTRCHGSGRHGVGFRPRTGRTRGRAGDASVADRGRDGNGRGGLRGGHGPAGVRGRRDREDRVGAHPRRHRLRGERGDGPAVERG